MSFATLKAGLFAAGILGTAAATAVPITFDFSNGARERNASYYNTLEMSQGGIDLDVTARSQGLFGWNSAQVAQWDAGLGVRGGGSNTQIDGERRDEALRFDFSQDVGITSISFMYFDGNDDAQIMDYDANYFWNTYVETIQRNETDTSHGISSFSFSDDFFTSLLGVVATDFRDDFTVLSLTVDTGETASVPEPSTVALLGIGLIGLGLCRRRSASITA